MDTLTVQRPRSVRSVSSNSSIGSGVSLSRRPRITRSRSRTVTGVTTAPSTDVPNVPKTPPDLVYLNASPVQQTLEENVTASKNPSMSQSGPAPVRLPRSPQRLEILDPHNNDTASSSGITDPDPTFVGQELTRTSSGLGKQVSI